MVDGSAGVDVRVFPVVRKGYDIEQVRAYLSEVEASFREWERWAVEARARFEIAEDKARSPDDVDEAMIAVFAAKVRIVEQGFLRAERIEAEARERARVDYEDAAGAIIREAEDEARRVIEGGLAGGRVEYDSLLQEARVEAARIIEEARLEARRLVEPSQADVTGQDAPSDSLVIDLRNDDGQEEAGDRSQRPTLYERRSAKLPNLGEGASDVLKSMENIREDPNSD